MQQILSQIVTPHSLSAHTRLNLASDSYKLSRDLIAIWADQAKAFNNPAKKFGYRYLKRGFGVYLPSIAVNRIPTTRSLKQ